MDNNKQHFTLNTVVVVNREIQKEFPMFTAQI